MADTAELIERLRADWAAVKKERPGEERAAMKILWANKYAESTTSALETLQAENERLQESESNLVKQINGYKDVLAEAEGIIADFRADSHSPRTRWG